jgi:hypothetical protein
MTTTATEQPGDVIAWTTRTTPAVNRRAYTGRHRPGPYLDRDNQRFAFPPAAPNYNPLHPADRTALAPHHWADRHLPAGPDERTAHMRRDDLAKAAALEPADTGQVLIELRADLGEVTP